MKKVTGKKKHWQLPRDAFKQASFEVMREKYGTDIKDEMVLKDRMGIYTPAKVYVYRDWRTDRWDINMGLPKSSAVEKEKSDRQKKEGAGIGKEKI